MKPEPRAGIEFLAVGGEPQPAREDLDDSSARRLVLSQLLARVQAEHRDVQLAIAMDDFDTIAPDWIETALVERAPARCGMGRSLAVKEG